MWFITFVPNFDSLTQTEVCQEHTVLYAILGRHWWFLTGNHKDGVILNNMGHHYRWCLSCMPMFTSLAWIKVCQEQPILKVLLAGCWCFFIEKSRSWQHGSPLYVVLELCADFQLSSMNKAVSRIPYPKFILEVVDDWVTCCVESSWDTLRKSSWKLCK